MWDSSLRDRCCWKQKKLVENKVAIKFKEGVLNIVLDEKNNIFMSGPVSEIKNIKVEI